MTVSLDTVVLGSLTGLTYALMALGLCLIYRSARFVNFAHGNLGGLVAVLFLKVVIDYDIPYWVAFAGALGLGAVLGALIELGIVRRLFAAPRLALVVATIAVSQLFLYFSLLRWLEADQSKLVTQGFPVPFHASVHVGRLVLTGPEIVIVVVVPLLALALAAFFRFTAYGQAIRAAAENPDAARLAGISVRRMSTAVWIIAGGLAAVTAILLAPMRSTFQVGSLGPSILVRALGAALMGRMTNLPVVFAGAIGIGIVEAVAFDNITQGGIQDLVVFIVVMVMLAVRAKALTRSARDAEEGLSFGGETRELPSDIAAIPRVRRLRTAGVVAALGIAVVLPRLPFNGFDTSEKTFLMTLVCAYAIVGLSLTLLTGWAGQVSLGHYALVGVGAFAAARLSDQLPLPALVIACGLIGMMVAIVVGIPALRIQGLFLAVSTLAFAVVASGWAFQQKAIVAHPAGVSIARPHVIRTEKAVYYFALLLLVLSTLAVRNLRRSGPGRALLAVRDNDRAARSQGLSAAGTRLLAFALSGFMAAVAGVVFAYARGNFTATDFGFSGTRTSPSPSLDVLLMVIIGGLGSIPGAILGSVFLFGIPIVFHANGLARLLTSAGGVIIVLLYLPGGLISLVHRARDAVVARIVRQEQGLPPPEPVVPPLRDLVAVARGRPLERVP